MKKSKQIPLHLLPLLMLSATWLFITCNNGSNHQEDPPAGTAETSVSSPIPLPDMGFDAEPFGEEEMKNEHPLSTTELQQWQISEIDRPLYQDDLSDFRYYLLKEVYTGPEGKVLLISRTSENEAFAWLASYDADDGLIDHQTVYYDEWAESALGITSVVRNDTITVSHYMMDLQTGEETTRIDTLQLNRALKFTAFNTDKKP